MSHQRPTEQQRRAEAARQLVDTFPPLTPEQRQRLRTLLARKHPPDRSSNGGEAA